MTESGDAGGTDDAQTRVFEAVVDAETMRTAVSIVHALFDEGHLHFDEDGLRMTAIDPATVASVDLTLERGAFESFEATDGHVGIDLSQFRDVVGIADADRPVRLALDPESRKLDVRIGELEYALALLDPETIRSPPDRSSIDLEFGGGVVADAEDFDRAVRAADMVSSHLALGIDDAEREFYVEAEGDTDDVSLALPADRLVDFDAEEAHSLFSVDYLSSINRAMPGGLEIDLELGTEHPLSVRYDFADGDGAVEYLVSPRIAAH